MTEPVGTGNPIGFDPDTPGRLVHFTDPRVRELAEARWRMDTGRDHQAWLMNGPLDRGNPFVREARDWLRAAVAIGLLTPIESETRRPIPAPGTDGIRCSWCGKSATPDLRVVTGPGVNICVDCVDLVNAVLQADGEPWLYADDDDPDCPRHCGHNRQAHRTDLGCVLCDCTYGRVSGR